MKRRDFLQRVGWMTTAMGALQAGLTCLGDRYAQALAQPTSRKLALLVGINQYADTALNGCVTDVELQRELLIHRFGFNPSDILVLTDRDATRQKIVEAFVHHLSAQAGSGDTIVFHFSGFGRRVKLGETANVVQNTLVPIDNAQGTVNDLLEQTLQLLWRSLSTDRVTAVLDTSYVDTGNGVIGNLKIRSLKSPSLVLDREVESDFAAQLLSEVRTVSSKRQAQERSGPLPGVVLAAASSAALTSSSSPLSWGEKALEAQWNGFSAGLFTYALTQYLWTATPATTLHISLSRATGVVEQLAGPHQLPSLAGQDASVRSLPVYYLTPNAPWGAEGAISAVEEDGKTAQLWLGGLPASTIEAYGVNSILTVAQTVEDAQPVELQIRSREGLTVKAKLRNPEATEPFALQPGQLVQESVRMVPRHQSLTVAISTELERIERVDATSAFASIPHVSTTVTGESVQPADCLFSKVKEADLVKIAATSAKSEGSYGLFSPSQVLIANTIGEKGEAVKTAVRRIVPQLEALRAAKLLRQTDNLGSSRLRVKAVLEMAAPREQILMQRQPIRTQNPDRPLRESLDNEMLSLSIGSRIRYRLDNQEAFPVYFLLFGLDDTGSIISISRPSSVAISPLQSVQKSASSLDANEEGKSAIFKQEVIPNGGSLTIPQALNSVEWAIAGPTGLAETLLIFSIAPFGHTLDTLKIAKSSTTGEDKSAGTLLNPLEVAQCVLQDLQDASEKRSPTLATSADAYALDTQAWATLRFIYRVV
ncbi:caspase family protein [Geitlerinema splendidum]|nr:caspase family protein [Geitlerinema splendidum]